MKVTFEANSLYELIDFVAEYIKDKKKTCFKTPINKFIQSNSLQEAPFHKITIGYIARSVKELIYIDEVNKFDLYVNGVLIKRWVNDNELTYLIDKHCNGRKGVITRSATCYSDIFVFCE